MTPKSTDRLTTIASTTGSTEAPVDEAPEAQDTKLPPKQPKAKMMGGMEKRKWNGKDLWVCPRCGWDTFNEGDAKVHTCNGRVAKVYEGDQK